MRSSYHERVTIQSFLAVLMLFLGVCHPSLAQDRQDHFSVAFQAVPLLDALKEVLQLSTIDLVYSRDLVEGQTAFCHAKNVDIDELLQCVLEETSLDFIRSSSGTYILIGKREIAPVKGNLRGGVYDAETGVPLPYANIILVKERGGVATNQDGLFNMPSLLSGSQPVAVSYVGYESVYDTVHVQAGENNIQEFFLRPAATEIDPIVISGLLQRVPSSFLGAGEVVPEDWDGISGVKTSDVLQGASRLLGVSIQQPIADLHIHGGAGNEHITLLDGVPVRNPVSMGRHLGAFSPLALERLVLRKTGFEARYGSHLTGVLSVDHTLSTDKSFSNAISIDPLSTNARVLGKFLGERNREVVVMGGARISNWDIYQDQDVRSFLTSWNTLDPLVTSFALREDVIDPSFQSIGGGPDVQFSDLHLATRFKLSPFHALHASLYRTTNNLAGTLGILAEQGENSPVEGDILLVSQNAYSWLNWAGQIRHSWVLGARSVLTSQLKANSHNSTLGYQVFFEPVRPEINLESFDEVFNSYQDSLEVNALGEESNIIRERGVYLDLNYGISSRHTMEAGVEVSHTESEFSFFQPFIGPLNIQPSTWIFAGYIQNTIPLGQNLVLVPGIRLTRLSSQSPVFAEPRFAIRFDEAFPRLGDLAVKLSGGLYRQYVHQYELVGYGPNTIVPYSLFWLPLDGSLAPSRAYHLAIESLWLPAPNWSVRFEGYSKWIDRQLLFDYATVQDFEVEEGVPLLLSDFVVATDGRSLGGGVGVEYSTDAFKGGISYEYAHAKQRFPGRFGGGRVSVPWNVPHQLAVDLNLQFTPQFGVVSNWAVQWGRSWAFRRAYYDVFDIWSPVSELTLPDFQNPDKDKLPAYQRVDLGIRYTWERGGFRSRVLFTILNVLDRENVYDFSVDARQDSYSRVPQNLPGRQFSLSLRLEY